MKIYSSFHQRSGSGDNALHFARALILAVVAAVAGCSETPTGATFLDRTHRIELEDALALIELNEGVPEDADSENLASPSHDNPFAPLSGDYGSATLRLLGFADVDGPSVIVAINDKLSVMAEGHEVSGIRVLKISPPVFSFEQNGAERRLSLSAPAAATAMNRLQRIR